MTLRVTGPTQIQGKGSVCYYTLFTNNFFCQFCLYLAQPDERLRGQPPVSSQSALMTSLGNEDRDRGRCEEEQ